QRGTEEDRQGNGRAIEVIPVVLLRDMRAFRLDVHGIKRRAAGHEETIPFGAAEADVAANLRQFDLADADAFGRLEDVEGVGAVADPAGARPDVAVHVAADAVGEAGFDGWFATLLSGWPGDVHRCEFFAVLQRLLIDDIPDLDVLRSLVV